MDKWKIKEWNEKKFQFAVVFKTILNIDEWIVIWGAVSVKMCVTYWWRDTVGHRAGNGRDEISRCVSECRVTVYCVFTGVSLNLLTVALLIDRQAEHIQFVPADTNKTYIWHLQAHWTCIVVFTAHRKCTFSDETSFVSPFPLFYPHKIGEYLDKPSNHWHLRKYCVFNVFSVMISCVLFFSDVLFFQLHTALNLLKPTSHVMHHQFNIQQLYALPALYLCVLYSSENKQRLVPLTA
jgi:hypothetical protein